jgi:hypothetical protein
MHQKKVTSKTSLTNISHIFVNNFFWVHFSKCFQQIRNQREILRFLIPILNFLIKKIFLLLLALFVHFDRKCAENGSKKRKIFFYECVLEFY